MPALILTILAPIGAWIHARRDPEARGHERKLEIYLLWWIVVAIGVTSVLSAAFHVFDGAGTAEMVGFTRGEGGFQFENAMGDLAIGVAGLLCIRFRGHFWLAVLLIAAIQYYGDAYGHFYQWIENGNTESGNIGPPLWLDLIAPTVGLILYRLHARAAEAPETPARVSAPPA